MKRFIVTLILLVLFIFGAGFAMAESYPWQDHALPFDFLFENHIDTHQQSKVGGKGQLKGFFYIRFTGDETEEGVPVARHANCSEVPDECTVGWNLHGVPLRATLVAHEAGQHPTWCVDPADLPRQPGFTHFHWLNESDHAGGLTIGHSYKGYLLKLTARETFFFEHHGGFLVTPGIDNVTHANVITDC